MKTQRYRGKTAFKTQAKIDVILPQTEERLGLPEAKSDNEGSSPRTFKRSVVLPTL